MPYQSISRQRHNYLRRGYIGNRSEFVDPVESYRKDVHGWARTAKTRMHDHCQSLLDVVANPSMLARAIDDIGRKKILGNEGPAGLPDWYPWSWLRELQTRVLNGRFRSGKYQTYKHPKIGKEGFRTIEIPDTESRILARSLCNVLTPILDPDFDPLSFGFRPGRSPVHCLAAADRLIRQGQQHIVSCDIRDAFGTIPRQRLLDVLRKRLHKSPVISLIEELLIKKRKKGIPQGLAISPICLNAYTDHMLDKWWAKHFPDNRLVRYADDIAVFCESQTAALDCYEALRNRIQAVGMQIKESPDEAIRDLSSGEWADWLGFRVTSQNDKLKPTIGEAGWARLEACLMQVKTEQDNGDLVTDDDLATVGCQWLTQKAVGVRQAQVPAVAEHIRSLADQCGLTMSGFTDEDALDSWRSGRRVAKRAWNEVQL